MILHYISCGSGFGVVSTEDDVVMNEKGEKRKINCGTEKGKHKSKNHRTAGTSTFKTKVFMINADNEKGLVYGFQQKQLFLGSTLTSNHYILSTRN